jgi:hypothetical protein
MNLALNEPLIDTLVGLFTEELPAVIRTLNTGYADSVTLEDPEQILPYMPTESGLEAGMPLIAVTDGTSTFQDDTVFSLVGVHELGIVAVAQDTHHAELAKILRRYTRALMLCIQQDREKASAGLLPTKTGAWYTGFGVIQPGPLLADRDPDAPAKQPSTFMSWSGFTIKCTREEI